MKERIDDKFLLNTEKLIKSVLVNCAKVYRAQYDSSVSVSPLDRAILDLKLSGGIETSPGYQESWLAQYFGQDLEKQSKEVPFIGISHRGDQLFFLNQLRNLIRSFTYNFQHLEYLLPEEKNLEVEGKKTTEFEFRDDQKLPIYLGLVRPVLAAIEQREIDRVKSAQQGAQTGGVSTEPSRVPNPYAKLGDNILVKGLQGEFDQVLSYAELKDLLEQIKTLRAQGKSSQEIIDFIKETFASLNIFVNDQGQLEIATASKVKPDQKETNLFSLEDLEKLFDLRLGLEMRGGILEHGQGQIAISTETVGIEQSPTETAFFDGGEVYLDQSGAGNIYFFVADREGSTAQVKFSVSDYRTSPSAPVSFIIAPHTRKIPVVTQPVKIPADQFSVQIPGHTLDQILTAARAQSPELDQLPESGVIPQPSAFGQAPAPRSLSEHIPTSELELPVQPRIIGGIRFPFPPRKSSIRYQQRGGYPAPEAIAPQPGVVFGPSQPPQIIPPPLATVPPQGAASVSRQFTEEEGVTSPPTQRPQRIPNFIKAFVPTALVTGATLGGSFGLHWLVGTLS